MTLIKIKQEIDSLIQAHERILSIYSDEVLVPLNKMIAELNQKTTASPTYWDIDDLVVKIKAEIEKLTDLNVPPIYVRVTKGW